MSDTVRIGSALVDRSHVRTLLARLAARAVASIHRGRWDRPGILIRRGDGRILFAAAVYRAPACRILFVWIGPRQYSWHLGCRHGGSK